MCAPPVLLARGDEAPSSGRQRPADSCGLALPLALHAGTFRALRPALRALSRPRRRLQPRHRHAVQARREAGVRPHGAPDGQLRGGGAARHRAPGAGPGRGHHAGARGARRGPGRAVHRRLLAVLPRDPAGRDGAGRWRDAAFGRDSGPGVVGDLGRDAGGAPVRGARSGRRRVPARLAARVGPARPRPRRDGRRRDRRRQRVARGLRRRTPLATAPRARRRCSCSRCSSSPAARWTR